MLTLYLYVNFSLIIRNERVSPLSHKADRSGIERAEDEIQCSTLQSNRTFYYIVQYLHSPALIYTRSLLAAVSIPGPSSAAERIFEVNLCSPSESLRSPGR
jgi:hypothetical protein